MTELTATWRNRRPHTYRFISEDDFDPLGEKKPPAMPRTFTGDENCIGCIYLIICKPTAQAYVGQSKNTKQRFLSHRGELRRGSHPSTRLQKAWDEHGESAFLFAVVERRIDTLFLHVREQFWMWRFGGRLLNKSESAHADRSSSIRLGALRTYTDEELIAELKRRNIAVMVVA